MKIKDINSEKIEAEIEKFESLVDFEFLPVIAQRSSYVEHVSWLLSLLMMATFCFLVHAYLNYFHYDSWTSKTMYYIGAVVLAVFISSQLSEWPAIQRLFISPREKQKQVQEKAQLIFAMKRLQDVKSKNALLLYISVMEKRIVLLPDPRIEVQNIGHINETSLKLLQDAFKSEEYESGLIQVIENIKSHLKDKFPRAEQGENSLPNKLIWWPN